MTQEDIIRMAREAGMFKLFGDPNAPEALTGESIERFFHMAQAAEREECANVCEAQITGGDYHYLAYHGHWDHMAQASTNCAAAIRARGEK